MIKIATLGFRGITDQLSRIDQGFLELGHILDYQNPDLIFQNNGLYEEGLMLASFYPKAKLILNILDLATHVSNYPYDLLKSQLIQADAITSISENTQSELSRLLNLKSEIIYNPLKITYRKPEIKKDILCLWVGRLDNNKRFNLVIAALHELGRANELHVVGPEAPPFGIYHGLVSDIDLNDLYNRSKFLISTTVVSGIELGMIEGQFCGVVPIACSDNPTVAEFLDSQFITNPFAHDLAAKIVELEKNRVEISQRLIAEAPRRYKKLHYLEVAKSILNVYRNLV